MIPIKTTEQIEGISKSGRLAAQTLKHLEQFVVPGVSTNELDRKAEQFIRDNGAIPGCLNYNGYPKSICTSINEVICHGVPSDNDILKEGDILNIDVVTVLDGYYGDTCRMYEIGEISTNAKKIIQIAKDCLEIGIDQCWPGNYFGNIGYAITKHAHANGFFVVDDFVGHGVGLEMHEKPAINHFITKKNLGDRMEPGMVFTIEPMINEKSRETVISENDNWTARTKDGGLSAQFEHMILITDTSCQILTYPPLSENEKEKINTFLIDFFK